MTYLAQSKISGAEPWQWVEWELDRCTLTHGLSPCPATGSPCFNGRATCQAPDAFTSAPYWVRMCEPRATIPMQFPFVDDGAPFFWPILDRVAHTPVKIDPGKSVGVRAELRITLMDVPHHDVFIDPYVSQRSYDPLLNGTFLQKLRARFPFFLGRRLRWYEGFLLSENAPEAQSIKRSQALLRASERLLVYRLGSGTIERSDGIASYAAQSDEPVEETTLAFFVRRDYVIERIEGPDRGGRLTIVAKDPLKLADKERAQDPLPTTAVLASSLDEEANPVFIDVVTTDGSQFPSNGGYVFINGEGFTYQALSSAIPENTFRLSGLTRSLPDGYETERKSHDAGDAVQVASYRQGTVVEVVRDLLLERAPGFQAEWIDFDAWQAEHDTWLGGQTISRMIAEPEGVIDLINEIVEQTLTWGFWWDEAAGKVAYRAVRPADISEVVAAINDDQHLVVDSVDRKDDPGALINEIQVLYGQRDPTERRDKAENYRRGEFLADLDSQAASGDNARRVSRVFGRWHRVENQASVLQFARRTLSSSAFVPVRIEFELALKDRPEIADFLDMTSIWIVDEFGLPRTTRVRVVRSTIRDDVIRYEAQEDVFKTRFGRWSPGELEGLAFGDATEEQRSRYLFWAREDGTMAADNSAGTAWL